MIEENFLLPECYVDSLLVQTIRSKIPWHIQNGIGNVSNIMQSEKQISKLLIAIVDNDKMQPNYFKEFKIIKKSASNVFKKHPVNNHYLIVICPAAETWLQNSAELVGVDTKFKSTTEFRKVCKQKREDKRIKALLNTLLQKKSPPMMEIKAWMEEILS